MVIKLLLLLLILYMIKYVFISLTAIYLNVNEIFKVYSKNLFIKQAMYLIYLIHLTVSDIFSSGHIHSRQSILSMGTDNNKYYCNYI